MPTRSSITSAKYLIEVSGVRSSCETIEMKSSFISLSLWIVSIIELKLRPITPSSSWEVSSTRAFMFPLSTSRITLSIRETGRLTSSASSSVSASEVARIVATAPVMPAVRMMSRFLAMRCRALFMFRQTSRMPSTRLPLSWQAWQRSWLKSGLTMQNWRSLPAS